MSTAIVLITHAASFGRCQLRYRPWLQPVVATRFKKHRRTHAKPSISTNNVASLVKIGVYKHRGFKHTVANWGEKLEKRLLSPMRLPFRHPGDVSWLPAILHGRRLLTDEAHAWNVAETLRESQPSGQGLGGGPIRAKCRTCRPGYRGHAIVHSMTERKSNVDAPHQPPARGFHSVRLVRASILVTGVGVDGRHIPGLPTSVARGFHLGRSRALHREPRNDDAAWPRVDLVIIGYLTILPVDAYDILGGTPAYGDSTPCRITSSTSRFMRRMVS